MTRILPRSPRRTASRPTPSQSARRLPRPLLALAAALGLALGLPGTRAEAGPVLVELFTSQGCNSCPPADAALGRLSAREDVVALSLHVDYWDYLGWRDVFASPEMTERQYLYRASLGTRVVYTPQMIVDGRHDVVGSHGSEVEAALGTALAEPDSAAIRIFAEGGMLKAELTPTDAISGNPGGTVYVARYERRATVAIERGENRGREITYHNVVRSLERIGDWRGHAPEAVMLPQPGSGEGIAVWIQPGGIGPVSAVAKYEP